MTTVSLISPADEARIGAAIANAEELTSGEIVAVIAQRSAGTGYFAVLWAALAALLVPWPLIYFTWWTMQWVFGLQIAVFLALLALLQAEPLQRWIVPKSVQRRWAHQRAVEQFLALGLHTTQHRTGVLIFVSVAERYAEILADTGIDKKVPAGTWQTLVDELTRRIGEGQPAEGFVTSIAAASRLLAAHFPPGSSNPDELPNRLIILN
jgi:putative membrane protein